MARRVVVRTQQSPPTHPPQPLETVLQYPAKCLSEKIHSSSLLSSLISIYRGPFVQVAL